jgi:DNA-binding SARP family transcriptional activator
MLQMNLFGSVRLASTDTSILRFRSQKEIALLIYLAQTGQPHRRDALADLLWDARSSKQALGNLRTTLTRLRQQVGDVVIVTRDALAFDPDTRQQVDSVRFEAQLQALATCRSADHARQIQSTLSLYTGAFLAAFSLPAAPRFNDWVMVEQERLRVLMQTRYQRLIGYALEHHDVDLGLESAKRWLVLDPTNEDAYCSLMQAQFLAGDRSAALKTYERCGIVLAEELDVVPSPAAERLAEAIRAPGFSHYQTSSTTASKPQHGDLPLVGRAAEYAQLVEAFRSAQSGHFQAVVVSGQTGIGKTRLVDDFLAWATLEQGDIFKGRAFETDAGLPYQPIIMALRGRLERENAPDDLLADVWLAELSRLLPELLERYPDLRSAMVPYGGDETMARTHLFESVARLGQAMSKRRPLVLFLDDWQWADRASLDLLNYLSQTWAAGGQPILLLVTVRMEDLGTDARLAEWLATWARLVSVFHLQLKHLTQADTVTFVEAWAGAACDEPAVGTLCARLYGDTGGNPFFMVEIVRMLAEQVAGVNGPGPIDLSSVVAQIEAGLPMPATVRQGILARLARFDETARMLLAAAAVLGRNCRFEEMCQVSGVDDLTGLSALDTLLASQIVVETGDLHQPYSFAHDKIRDVVYTEAGFSRRRIFHRRALGALEHAMAPAAELAYHALAAREWELAFRYSLAAGDAAMQIQAVPVAIDQYEQALGLLHDERVQVDAVIRQHLDIRLGMAMESR